MLLFEVEVDELGAISLVVLVSTGSCFVGTAGSTFCGRDVLKVEIEIKSIRNVLVRGVSGAYGSFGSSLRQRNMLL